MNLYLALIRQRIADLCEEESPFQGEIEVDESYFGANRIKGKRGRGAGRKTPVFGILQRVYTEIVPDCARKTLQAIIRGKVEPDSVMRSDWWKGYNGLVDLGYKNITVFIMGPMSLPEGKAISMVSNPSGHLLKEGL